MRYLLLIWLFWFMVSAGEAKAQSNTCSNGDVLVVNTGGAKNYQCIPLNQQPAGTGSTMIVANAGSTGTTLNKFAKLTGAPSTAVVSSNGDTTDAIGVVTAGAGTTGNATITILGQVSCVFDGATTAGDYVTIAATGGGCHDAGATYPTGSTTYGRVLSTNGGAGTYVMELMTPDITGSAATSSNGKNKPGSPTNSVQYNSSNAFAGSANFTWDNTNVVLNVGANTNHGAINLSNNGQDFISNPIGELDISSVGAIYMYPGNSVSWAFTPSSGGSKAFIPYGSDGGFDIGSTGGGGKRVAKIYFKGSLQGIQDTITASTPFINHTATWNDGSVTFHNQTSNITNSASATASTLFEWQVGGTTKWGMNVGGLPIADQTITAGGTTGNQTINKAAGTVNVAAGGTAVTVTNSLVTTSSTIYVMARTNDTTCYAKNAVPGSGTFTINLVAACTAETSFGFFVIN